MALSSDYKKYIFLPSNNISYSPSCWLIPPKYSFVLLNMQNNINNTNFEFFAQVMKEHLEAEVDVEDLFLFDFYYLWFSFHTLFIKDEFDQVLKMNCAKCSETNSVKIASNKLLIRNYNQYENNFGNFNYAGMSFRPRKVRDNLEYPYLSMSTPTFVEKVIVYLFQQSTDEKTKENIHKLNFKDLIDIFYKVIEYNKMLGIYDKVVYKCHKCGHENSFHIYDDLELCSFNLMPPISSFDKTENYFGILNLMNLDLVNSTELFSLPYGDMEDFRSALNKVELKPKI